MENPSNVTWHQVHDVCSELRKVMDGMIEQKGFETFRPGLARTIARARDEHQLAARHGMPARNAIRQV